MRYLGGATHLTLFEDGEPMAFGATSLLTQNIRGAVYPAGGIWGVATHPSARRKGFSRSLIGGLFQETHTAGAPVSTLYAFRESFYERLGYIILPQPRTARFSPVPLSLLLKAGLQGSVQLMPIQEGFSLYRAYLREYQKKMHGMVLFNEQEADWMREENKYWLALAEFNDQVIGAMLYRIEGQGGTLASRVFYYDNMQGRYLLLEWLARHVDQVKDVELKLPPSERPEMWYADMNVLFSSEEPALCRVVNLDGLSGMEVGPGAFSARISDAECPWNDGIYTFECIDGKLYIDRAQRYDCSLTVNGITALIYGTHDPESFVFRGWGDPPPAVQAAMRTMFSPKLPFLHERF